MQNQLTKKKADLQAAIRARIPSCNVDVPVVTLGGATLTNSNAQSAWLAKEKEGFDVLWNFLQVIRLSIPAFDPPRCPAILSTPLDSRRSYLPITYIRPAFQ